MSDVIRVVVADDHPVVRDGLTALLRSVEGFDVVASAATGQEAVREAVAAKPHVVVMDVQMPELDGVAATTEIRRVAPDVAVLVLTMYDDETVFAAMRAGASGYLVKGAEQDEILRAIRSVAAGEAIFGAGAAARVRDFFSGARPDDVPFPELTGREREVLDLIAAGLPNQSIASQLHLSPKTVGNHISSIFAKLCVAGRAEAIVKAREAGLGRG